MQLKIHKKKFNRNVSEKVVFCCFFSSHWCQVWILIAWMWRLILRLKRSAFFEMFAWKRSNEAVLLHNGTTFLLFDPLRKQNSYLILPPAKVNVMASNPPLQKQFLWNKIEVNWPPLCFNSWLAKHRTVVQLYYPNPRSQLLDQFAPLSKC